MKPEEWRPVPGWPAFEVSDHGRVRTVDRVVLKSDGRTMSLRGKIYRPCHHPKSGHLQVGVSGGGKRSTRTVHSLVAETFIGPRPEGMEVCHNDGNHLNNLLTNLRYGTRSDNMKDRVRHGVHNNTRKTHCPRHHPLREPNLLSKSASKGRRGCLACARAMYYMRDNAKLYFDLQSLSDRYYAELMTKAAA